MRMDRFTTVTPPTDAGNFEAGDTIRADNQAKTFTFARTEAVEEVPRQLIEDG